MYTNVIFQSYYNTSKLKVFVEKYELNFDDQGLASIALVEGQQYNVYCFASGKTGSYYELLILEPKNIPLHIFRTIDSSNEDRGKHAFTISMKKEYAFSFS